jgi:hypothetical protein
MNTLTMSSRSRLLLMKCIAVSLVVHIVTVTFFYFHPLILQGPFKSLFGMTVATPTLLDTDEENSEQLKKKNQMLEEVFEQIVVLSPHFQQPYDLIELPKGIALAPSEEETMPILPQDTSLPGLTAPRNDFALTAVSEFQDQEDIPALFVSEEMSMPVASQLQIDPQPSVSEILPIAVPMGQGKYEDLISISDFALHATFETDYSLNLSPQLVSPSSLKVGEDLALKADMIPQAAQVTSKDLKLENEKVRSTLFIPKAAQAVPEAKEVKVASLLSDLEQYDFPPIAMATEWNNDFDVNVVFLPNPEGQGYIFSLSVQPNYDFSNHSLRQNLYFVIDRSNSVQKHRFAVFKRAVLKALASMQHGDTFNIVILDKKLTTFSPQSRPVTIKNIQAAEEFLEKEEAGGLFAAGEMYTSLEKVLALIPESDEIHTAILLTDGKSSLNPERKQKAMKKWVDKNNGKLAVYTAAVGRDNDLVGLDMLSSISGGRLLYSDTHASLPRKLAKLVLDLKDPIAKDLLITAVPHHPQSHIEFYAAGSHLPALYSHQPYLLIGQIDDPCAFDLIIQGRHHDQWIAIKKNVSFIEGQKGSQALESDWSAQHANRCYAKFLEEGKIAHLKEAKEILKKSRYETALE